MAHVIEHILKKVLQKVSFGGRCLRLQEGFQSWPEKVRAFVFRKSAALQPERAGVSGKCAAF